jgi:hypothetical protein
MLDGGALDELDFASCEVRRVVSRGVAAPVRFSPDGRWIAYGPQAMVVPAGGGSPRRPLATALAAGGWAWAPGLDRLVGVTARGGLVTASPGGPVRRLLPDGFGATGLMFGPGGRLAVSREVPRAAGARSSLWLLGPAAAAARPLYRDPRPGASLELATFAADGKWLVFWENASGSASIAADGLPLEASPVPGPGAGRRGPVGGAPVRVAAAVLPNADLVSSCGAGIVFADGAGRETSLGKRLAIASPPTWRPHLLTPSRLSFVSPVCPASGARIIATAGPSRPARVFGEEGRSLFVVSPSGGSLQQLTDSPPSGITDESPQLTHNPRDILFIRSGPTNLDAQTTGQLYVAHVRPRYYATVLGPFAALGPVSDYYGAYAWSTAFSLSDR